MLLRNAQAAQELNRPPRKRHIPVVVWLDAAGWFLLRFFTIVVLGVPLQSILKHPKSMDAPWIWSFWFRLPIVVGIGYGIYPWWLAMCSHIFRPSENLVSVIASVFAPLMTLLYSALAGYAVVSLWGRLEKVRSSLHKEFALLEILERRIPKESLTKNDSLPTMKVVDRSTKFCYRCQDNKELKSHFQNHVDGVERYEVQRRSLQHSANGNANIDIDLS